MTKNSIKDEQSRIILVLNGQEDGLSISEISASLNPPIGQRTLLRRLTQLVEEGRVSTLGRKKGNRYFLATSETVIPYSAESESLRRMVQRPLSARQPVSYQTQFLYDYQPNQTWYLPHNLREHLKEVGQPFQYHLEPGTYVKRIIQRLLIELSWNSSRLEGNTYSLLETERLIEFGLESEEKPLFEAQMILNHKEAITFIMENLAEVGLNKFSVLNLHALLSNNLLGNPKACGRLRQIPVGIGRTTYQPTALPQIIEECFEMILRKADHIQDPFEQSFFAMVHLPYLQPFEDVNKRVSRLVSNISLLKNNLCPLSFTDVSKEEYVSAILTVYELNRIEVLRDLYVWAYERSAAHFKVAQETLGEPNLLRMRWNAQLVDLIHSIVKSHIKGPAIVPHINAWANKTISEVDRNAVIAIAEREIRSLHEGNLAIYHLKLDDFVQW